MCEGSAMLELLKQAISRGDDLFSPAFASRLDAADKLNGFRDKFCVPPTEEGAVFRTPGTPSVYLCGNSLGLAPKETEAEIVSELKKWQTYGVEGHFKTDLPWATIETSVAEGMAAVVGARPSEVAIMNTLTTNLHLLMVPFYKPTATRFKILIEDHAFPSDTYAVKSQLAVHGRTPEEALVLVSPRAGEELIRVEDILAAIEREGEALSLVLFTGVQYYTGQFFDLPTICSAAHAVGARFGVDLAHAVGNLPLYLHDWDVDFAAWCSYKYLNSGPGGIAGLFVHSKFDNETMESMPFFAGWWGHERETRFQMGSEFKPMVGAGRFQLSNPAVFQTAALRASLRIFTAAGGMEALRAKSLALTGYLEALLGELEEDVSIITPRDAKSRGCQLSLTFKRSPREVYKLLQREGIIIDFREPNVVRVAPTPLYNTAADVLEFVATLKLALAGVPEADVASPTDSVGGASAMRPGAPAL